MSVIFQDHCCKTNDDNEDKWEEENKVEIVASSFDIINVIRRAATKI